MFYQNSCSISFFLVHLATHVYFTVPLAISSQHSKINTEVTYFVLETTLVCSDAGQRNVLLYWHLLGGPITDPGLRPGVILSRKCPAEDEYLEYQSKSEDCFCSSQSYNTYKCQGKINARNTQFISCAVFLFMVNLYSLFSSEALLVLCLVIVDA